MRAEDGNRLLVAVVLPDLEATKKGIGVLAETDVVRNVVDVLRESLGIASSISSTEASGIRFMLPLPESLPAFFS